MSRQYFKRSFRTSFTPFPSFIQHAQIFPSPPLSPLPLLARPRSSPSPSHFRTFFGITYFCIVVPIIWLDLPSVGYASAVDLGDTTSPEESIHPRNKQEVGA
eukprot:Phypoly_transcript_22591.p1 GENE.Phypoly_transcript_22591~~Phypoly_transcript_22591.p1  ORF type:complete len:102 (+),score=16.15 Phypoly_transcript_22591:100-405(+)